jgi:hypothetical protein
MRRILRAPTESLISQLLKTNISFLDQGVPAVFSPFYDFMCPSTLILPPCPSNTFWLLSHFLGTTTLTFRLFLFDFFHADIKFGQHVISDWLSFLVLNIIFRFTFSSVCFKCITFFKVVYIVLRKLAVNYRTTGKFGK